MRALRLHAVRAGAQHLLESPRRRACAADACAAAPRARRAAHRRRRRSCRRCARRLAASCVRSTMSASSGATLQALHGGQLPHRPRPRRTPAGAACLRARSPARTSSHLAIVLVVRQASAHQLEAQVDQVRVDDVGLAVVADVLAAALEVRVPDALARHAELARASRAAAPSGRGRPGRGPGSPPARPSGRCAASGSG